MAVEKKLNQFQYLNDKGELIKRNFKETDDKIAALENATKDATTEIKGIVELATNDETKAGIDSTRVVTPAGLAAALAPINSKLEDVTSGVPNFAYKNYTIEANQSEMVPGIVYLVPFTKDNQFIALNPSTNAPVDSSKEIAYYLHCIIDADGNVTSNQKTQAQGFLENVAYTNKANVFSEKQTIQGGASVTGGLSADTVITTGAISSDGVDIATVEANSKVHANAAQVKSFVESFATECLPESQISDDIEKGKLYIYYED